MIANLIGGFVAILIGVSLIGPISTEVQNAQLAADGTSASAFANLSSWGSTVLDLVPGFFALGIMGIGVAITYSSLRSAGIV